jgi:hypothetical protein
MARHFDNNALTTTIWLVLESMVQNITVPITMMVVDNTQIQIFLAVAFTKLYSSIPRTRGFEPLLSRLSEFWLQG